MVVALWLATTWPIDVIGDDSLTGRAGTNSESAGGSQRIFASTAAPWTWQVVPDGLLYRSYRAGPKEPRFANVFLYDTRTDRWTMEPTLGGRVGLMRYGTTGSVRPQGWQLDFEGAVMPRLDVVEQMDVDSVDYRFGLLNTLSNGQTSMKFGYFHISSHAGDEFLIKNPTYERINYVRESLVLGVTQQLGDEWRVYGEVAYAFAVRGGAEPWEVQFGTEYSLTPRTPETGAPFAAVNVDLRQEAGFDPGVTVMTGWQWKSPHSGRSARLGLQYSAGPSNQYQFFRERQQQIGVGLWFDY